MKVFFTIFSCSIFLLIEILFGNIGIFFPISAVGLLYFAQTNSRLFTFFTALFMGVILDFFIFSRTIPVMTISLITTLLLLKTYRHFIHRGLFINSVIGGILFCIIYLIGMGANFFSNYSIIVDIPLFLSTIGFQFLLGGIGTVILLPTLEFIAAKLKIQQVFKSDNTSHSYNYYYSSRR